MTVRELRAALFEAQDQEAEVWVVSGDAAVGIEDTEIDQTGFSIILATPEGYES